MPQRIKDRLLKQEQQNFVGRTKELATLLQALEDDGPLVNFVHGLGGMGKSSLLRALAEAAEARGAAVIRLDCRTIQPSEQGLLEALSGELGQELATWEAIYEALAQREGRIVLTFDTYEVFRLLDTWLRQVFVPNLPDHVRLFFFGREAPVAAWLTTPGWQGLFQSLRLGPLDQGAATELLLQAGVDPGRVGQINHFTKGHPLALRLAAAALLEQPDLKLEEIESRHVVEELARIYLRDVRDPLTRRLLEAASVLRRATRSLLGAMLPEIDPQAASERLKTLPFVESGPDGLIIHDVVRQAVETSLRASDPSQHRRYRQAAWRQLRAELESAGQPHLWRYTADTIYLIEHPAVRDAFFPPGEHLYAMEQARLDDGPAILAITARHDGPEATSMMAHWWQHLPEAFFVVRDPNGGVIGYYALFDPARVSSSLLRQDPLCWGWWQHLRADPVPQNQSVVFGRRSLAAETGEDLSAVQAACWLDIKRTYLANPQLRRIYTTGQRAAFRLHIVSQLGFRLYPDLRCTFDGQTYETVMNDFGPRLVPGWLANLVEAQYGPEGPETRLNPDARELLLEGQPVSLTPLEFGVMNCLYLRQGKAVSRVDLLEEVWGYEYDGGGSNVVDSVVRSLRKKLGDRASTIETVTGVGYRFRGF